MVCLIYNPKKIICFGSKKMPGFFNCKLPGQITEGWRGLAVYARWNMAKNIVHDKYGKTSCATGALPMKMSKSFSPSWSVFFYFSIWVSDMIAWKQCGTLGKGEKILMKFVI